MKPPKLIVIVDEKSHFSLSDIDLLRDNYPMIPVFLDLIEKDFLKLFKIGMLQIIPGILKSDISITWFVDYHTVFVVFFSKLFRKKSVVIIGGHEVCNMPEINYGYQRLLFRGFIVRWVLRNATAMVIPSRSYAEKVQDLVALPAHVIPLYSRPDNFALSEEKTKSIVMVANQYLTRDDYISLKGIATYDKVAKELPEYPFYLIGRTDPQIREMFTNIRYPGEMNHGELLKVLAKTKVYCQLSYTESFGVSLLEALQSGCIPVVTGKDGMKELVNGNGYSVTYGDVESTVKAIRNAFISPEDRTGIAHQYQNDYSQDRRRTELMKLIASIHVHNLE